MIMSKKHKKMVTIIISLMLIIFLSYRVLNPRVGRVILLSPIAWSGTCFAGVSNN